MKYKNIKDLKIEGDINELLLEFFKTNHPQPFEALKFHHQKIGYFAKSEIEAISLNTIIDNCICLGIWLEKNNLIKKDLKSKDDKKASKKDRNPLSMIG